MTVLKSLLSSFRRSRSTGARRTRRPQSSRHTSAENLEQRLLLTNPDPFSSLPGASVTIYLDFDGHMENSAWNTSRLDNTIGPITTPAFDTNGAAGTFGDSERELIEEIYERVAEDFRPFDINVTTVEPNTFPNARSVFVSVGGDGAWSTPDISTTAPPPNRAIVDGFSDGNQPQTVFVFPTQYTSPPGQFGKNLAAGISEAVAISMGLEVHEAADDSRLVGTADVGPILGNGTGSERDIWFNAPGAGPIIQDDLASIVSNPTVRYRADDHGGDTGTATAFTVGAGTEMLEGVISENNDVDTFFFSTIATSATISITGLDLSTQTSVLGNGFGVTNPGTNLDPVIRLLDGSGNELAIDNGTGLTGSITRQLTEGGYYIEVSNGGEYGNLGEYTISVQGVDTPQVLGNPVLLESLPNAPVTIYLDFDGHIESDPAYIALRGDGLTTDILNPAYDTDGNSSSFSPAEINAMREIFFRIAEDFRPFNVNVSTRDAPATLVDRQSMRVVIGGDGAWTPNMMTPAISVGAGAFFNPAIPNTAFVFSDNVPANVDQHGKYIGYYASSRIANMLGLDPHLEFVNGVPTGNRHQGTPEVGPLFSDAFDSLRDVWQNLPANDPSTTQDDLALITNPATNAIVYREDDHGNSINTATPITVSTDQEVVQGIIGENDDVDVFSFQTLNTTATIEVSGLDLTTLLGSTGVTNPGTNLDPVLTLRRENGSVISVSDPLFVNGANESLKASVTTQLTAGTYYIEISNRQEYGNLGEYTITIDGVNGAPVTVDAIPSTFREDAGPNASIGRVFRPTTQDNSEDLLIQLVSTDEEEVIVPASVTIPAGANSATFPIDAVDDIKADGAQRVEIRTFVNSEFNSTLVVIVQDHEFITVEVDPNPVREDAGAGGATLTVRRSNDDVGPPNHFVAVEDRIEEYDFEGNLVSTIPVPWHGGVGGNTGGGTGGSGVANILVVSDSDTDDGNIRTALVADGHTVTVVTGDYISNNATLRGDLSQYGAVYWSATGNGLGGVHTDASVFSNLESYVQSGGRVFVTGADSVASPTDNLLINFLGASSSIDVPPGPGTVTNIENSLTTGVVDIRGIMPTGGFPDFDELTGLSAGTVGVVASSGGFGFQWTLRTLGAGEIAYVSNGSFGSQIFFGSNFGEHPSWLDTSAGGAGAYNAALRNFAVPATNTTEEIVPIATPNVPRPPGETVHDVLVLPDGNLAVYNGSDSSALSHYNVTTGEWSHYVIAGLSTDSGTGPTGGIASFGDFIFMTDMQVNNDAFGLVRLNLLTGELDRFGSVQSGFRLFSNNIFQGSILELDPISGAIVNTISAPAGVAGADGGLAFDGTTLWALNTASNTIYGLNPDTGAVLSTHVLSLASNGGVLASGFTGLATLNGLLYVLDPFIDDAVYIYNPTTRTQVGGYAVGGGTSNFGISLDDGLSAITGPDALLAADIFTDQIYIINPANGAISGVINTGISSIEGLATANGEIYVGSRITEDIRVFSRDGQLLRTLDVNSSQVAFGNLALGGDNVEGTIRADNRYIDVSVGLDGLVYGIGENQTTVRRFNPNNLALESTITLASPVRTITVDGDGIIYGGDDSGTVFAFNPDGSVLRTASSGAGGLADIQINVSREIIMSDSFGRTLTSDSDFSTFTPLEDTTGTSFVTFARHQSLPTGDLIVTLTNPDPTELDIPTEVTIPVNFREVTIPIDVIDDNERDGDQDVVIVGTAPSYESGTTTVTVTEHEIFGVDVIPASVQENAGAVADGIRVFRSDVDGPLDFPLQQSGAVTTATPLLDDDVVVSQIAFKSQISRITDVNVTLSIEHQAIPDLDVFLISPSGTRVELFTDLSSNETTMSNTVLDDEAGQRILDGSDPYTGRFRPEKLLSTFDGENPSGLWTLEVIDDNQSDVGTLLNWSLEIETLGLSAAVVGLTSDDVSELTVPVNITIPFNQSEVFVPFDVIDDALLDGTQTVTVSPDIVIPGFELQSDTIDVTDVESLLITLSANTVSEAAGSNAIQGTVTRTDLDTTQSVVLSLVSSDTSELSVPNTVIIPAGSSSATFAINAVDDLEFDGSQSVIITASSGGYEPTDSEVITVTDQEPRLQMSTLSPTVDENSGQITITLARLDADDLTVPQQVLLTSSDTTELTVPASVIIPAGEISTSFVATILGDTILDGDQTVTITAIDSNTANPVINGTSLDITVADSETVSITADINTFAENAGAAVATATVSVSISDHTSPLFIDLINSDVSEISIPDTVIIPVGETSATFEIDAVDDPIIDLNRVATITGRLAGFQDGTLDITVTDYEPPVATGPTTTTEDPTPTLAWAAVDGATRYDLWVNDVSRNIIQLFRHENLGAASPFFTEDFESGVFDAGKWVAGSSATTDGLAIGSADGTAAHLNGSENSLDRLESIAMDLSTNTSVELSYSFQRTGRGSSPSDGFDLVIRYRDANGNWLELNRQDGSGPDMTQFEQVNVSLPAEALHSNFALRVESFGPTVDTLPVADWFVDEIKLTSPDNPDNTQLFIDDFVSGTFDSTKWAENTGVTIDGLAIRDSTSGRVSAHLDASDNGIDRLESVTMDLSGKAGVQLTYSFQQTGRGGSPEAGNDLVLSYRNAEGNWLQLGRQLGSDGDMSQFRTVVVHLPEAALHSNFAFRIESFGPIDDGDETTVTPVADWFVDSVQLSEFETFTPTQELGVGRYRFWVRAYDALEQPTAWSRGRDFLIRTRPQIVSPANQRFVAANSFPEISWTSVVDTARYDLWINNVTTGENQVVRETNLQTTSFASELANLQGGTYRAWVRAIGPDGTTGHWSSSSTFTVLATPTNVGPTGTTFDRTPELRWDPVVGASSYFVWLTLRNPGADPVVVLRDRFVTNAFRIPDTDLQDGNYALWVQAIAADNTASLWSPVTEFTVGGRPEIIIPNDNTLVSSTPTFLWTGITGTDVYEVWVNRVDVPQNRIVYNNAVEVASFTVDTPLPAGTYRLWVRAISDMGEASFWSRPVNFTVGALAQNDSLLDLQPETGAAFAEFSTTSFINSDVRRFAEAVTVQEQQPKSLATEEKLSETTVPSVAKETIAVEQEEAVDSIMAELAVADWWTDGAEAQLQKEEQKISLAGVALGAIATGSVLRRQDRRKKQS